MALQPEPDRPPTGPVQRDDDPRAAEPARVPLDELGDSADIGDASGSDDTAPDPQVRVAGFERYVDAQAAVDHLSDAEFDITGTAITWSGLRQIEYVTGRRTVATAVRDGFLSGAWFGLIVSLLLLAFVEFDEGASGLAFVVTWTLVIAVMGALWSGLMHWQLRGTRDFATMPRLEAERYDVWVPASQARHARVLLGRTDVRAGIVDDQRATARDLR